MGLVRSAILWQQAVNSVSKTLSEFTSSRNIDSTFDNVFGKSVTISTNSMLAARHFDLVIAIDIHWIWIGPVPVPIPYPFLGMIFDPIDYIHFTISIPAIPMLGIDKPVSIPMGGSVYVNGRHKAATTTSIFGLVLPLCNHIGPLVMPPMGVNDGEVYFGSPSVITQGVEMSAADCQSLTCWDPPFGTIVLPTNPRKGFKFPLALYNYPLSMMVLIGSGKPVFVGGVKEPHKYTAAEMLMRLVGIVGMKGLGRMLKGMSKGAARVFNKLLKKMFGENNRLSALLCRFDLDPVNLITGSVVYDYTDFNIPGVIPIEWSRSWNSDVTYDSIMGHRNHMNYDLPLKVDKNEGYIGLLLTDGRPIGFEPLLPGQEAYNRQEKITLSYDGREYRLMDWNTRLIYVYQKLFTDEFVNYKAVRIENEDGFNIKLKYDDAHTLNRIIDTAGRNIIITKNKENRIVSVDIEHDGASRHLVSYGYNQEGDLDEIRDAEGQSTILNFENHLMMKKTDRNGHAFYWEYDDKERCIHSWGDGGILEGWISYKKGYNEFTNGKGTFLYYYDENNLCTQITDPLGNNQYFEYNEYFEINHETDGEGNTTIYQYDEKGNQKSIALPNNATTSFNYDESNRLVNVSDAEGGSSYYHYDEKGKLERLVKRDKSQMTFEYHDNGLLLNVLDEKDNRTSFIYDKDTNLIEISSGNGMKSHREFDEWGRNVRTIDAAGRAQSIQFDKLGRISRVDTTDRNRIKLEYNAYDEVTRATDKQRDVRFEYTPLGSLKMREENGTRVYFKYDKDEDLRSIRNEHNELYRFHRDAAGNIFKEVGFDGMTKSYKRDRAGKVIRVDRPEEKWSEYEYDAIGNILRTEFSDGTFEVYGYDGNSQLIYAENQNSELVLERDSLGRVVKEIQDGYEVISEYGVLGNKIALKSSLGANIQYELDDVNRTSKISAINSEGDQWESKTKYDSLGQELECLFSNGIKVSNRYNSKGYISEQQVSNGRKITRHKGYEWDVNGRLNTIMDLLGRGRTDFNHDDFGNLASAKYEDGTFDFKMPDAIGNLYKTKERKDRKYGKGSRLLECEQFLYNYDEEGNLTEKKDKESDKLWEYVWYGNGMLKNVRRPDRNTISFEYDALGRRTAKIHKQPSHFGNHAITRFIWDTNVPLHEWKYNLNDRPTTTANTQGELLKEKEPILEENLITWVFKQNSFIPIAKIINNEEYSIISDYLGTPTQAYDKAGELIWEAELDIYGKIRKLVGESSFIPFRYQGQYEDLETGLYYNRFRYYSPDMGMYICQDPIGHLGSNPNFYAYVLDANSWLDIFGLDCSSDAAKLRKSMQDADALEPGYKNSAHHIVMSNSTDPKMVKLRQKMKQLGIDKNTAENGVYLPTSSKIKTAANTSAHSHSRVHTKVYKQNVYDRLKDINNKGDFQDALMDIGEELSSGLFGIK